MPRPGLPVRVDLRDVEALFPIKLENMAMML